jgi:hypothetical protein
MREITPPSASRGWQGKTCTVWVHGLDGLRQTVRVVLPAIRGEEFIEGGMPAPDFLDLVSDLAAAANQVREALVEAKKASLPPEETAALPDA